MSEPAAFYIAEGDGTFASTPATAGPWGPENQHGGPPAALLVRAFELTETQSHSRIARFAMEILRPVPVAPLTVRTAVVRQSRRVTLLRGVIEAPPALGDARHGTAAPPFPSIPPATVSFHATAVIHPRGSVQISSISKELEPLLPADRQDAGVVIELIPEGQFLTYGVGVSLTDMQKPELARAAVPVAG